MPGIHAARRFTRRAADAVTAPAPQQPESAPAPAPAVTALVPFPTPLPASVPFDGRHRPSLPVAEPLGPRPTDPDPEREAPVDEAAEAVYRGIQAHLDQYTAPFKRAI